MFVCLSHISGIFGSSTRISENNVLLRGVSLYWSTHCGAAAWQETSKKHWSRACGPARADAANCTATFTNQIFLLCIIRTRIHAPFSNFAIFFQALSLKLHPVPLAQYDDGLHHNKSGRSDIKFAEKSAQCLQDFTNPLIYGARVLIMTRKRKKYNMFLGQYLVYPLLKWGLMSWKHFIIPTVNKWWFNISLLTEK